MYRSRCPKTSIAVHTILATCPASRTSVGIATTSTPVCRKVSSAVGSGARLAMARRTPSAAKALAMPNPMPLAPPVINAVLPRKPLSIR